MSLLKGDSSGKQMPPSCIEFCANHSDTHLQKKQHTQREPGLQLCKSCAGPLNFILGMNIQVSDLSNCRPQSLRSPRNRAVLAAQEQACHRQHVMAVPERRVADEEDNVNDSGFGSGGFSVYKPLYDCNNELDKLEINVQELNDCCFYYGSVSSQEARHILGKKAVGTFFLRDSSDSRYLYSLSLKTERGATSVRIVYNKGLFQFDSDEKIRNKLPCFESVLALIDFHVMVTQSGHNKSWRWEENSGKKSMKVNLATPLKCSVPSLAHLSRVKINQCLEDVYMPQLSVDKLSISSHLKNYLKAYPYRV